MFESLAEILTYRATAPRRSWSLSRWWQGDRRSVSELSLLRMLSLAHRERLDVRPLVDNLAREFRGAPRRRLRRLSRQLNEGVPLIDALEQTPDALRDEEVLSLRFARSLGTLPQTYVELIERAESRPVAAADQVRQALKYGFGLMIIFCLLISFLMTFISPTFSMIYNEFGIALPLAHQYLLHFTDWLGHYLPLIALLLVVGGGLCWLVSPLRQLRRWLELRPLRTTAQLQRSHLLRMLAQSEAAGRPLPSSLSTLARYHFSRNTRVKLLVARNEIEQGANSWDTLASTQLISAKEAQALAAASSVRLRTWIMRRLAQQKEEGVQLRRVMLAMFVHPIIVLFFGAIVAWIAVAFFGVLTTMITVLA